MDQEVATIDFSTSIICQARSGKAKQFNIITSTDDDELFKGPYNNSKAGNENPKLISLVYRSDIMKNWNTPLIVHPLPDEGNKIDIFQMDCGNELVNGKFVAFPNLIKDIEQNTVIHTEKFGANLSYTIIKKRTGLVRLSDYIAENPNETWFFDRNLLIDIILAHIHLYILSVGDRTLSNILLKPGTKEIFIVDYEENRAKDVDDELFYFTQPPVKIVSDKWLTQVRKIYPDLLEMNKFGINADLNANHKTRADKVRDILEKYSKETTGYTGRPRNAKETKIKESKNAKKTIVANGTNGTNVTKEEQKPVKAPRKIKPIEIIDNGNLGQMEWCGQLSKETKSYGGHSIDLLKNCVREYIRRGVVEKALMAAVELFRMNEVGGTAPITNLVNKLKIIAVEDIGISDIEVLLYSLSVLNKSAHTFKDIANVIALMCKAKKTMLVSHVWKTYCTEDGRKYAAVHHQLKIASILTKEDE